MKAMLQSVLNILSQAERNARKAVVLMPSHVYWEGLKALSCKYAKNAGRTALMANGHLVTILASDTPVEEVSGGFDLYLSGWGNATPKEERSIRAWLGKADAVFTEIS
jgi:hypothetical protein